MKTENLDELFGVGLYSVSDTARILSAALSTRVSQANLRRWAHGRNDVKMYASVVDSRRLKIASRDTVKFLEMIELLTVAAMRIEGAKMRDVRAAYIKAKEQFGEYPFATKKYSLLGSGIYVKNAAEGGGLVDLASGNRAFEKIVKPLLHDIVVYDGNFPSEMSPLGQGRAVVLNPGRSFGEPIDRETGVPTYAVYGMSKSGGTVKSIASWYRMSEDGVSDAIEYETKLAKAA